ncbi:MAG: hypothetical protein AB1649_02480 [Chloroflexota bacterium]
MGIVHSALRLLNKPTQRNHLLRLLRDPTQGKYVFRWLESLEVDYFLNKRQPWLVFEAIDFLKSLPLESRRVFEYGSGGSTLFWLSRKMKCVSIEHDPEWYESVRSRLARSMEIDYRLVQPEGPNPEGEFDISDPTLYLSGDVAFQRYSFKNYAKQIDEFPPGYFDVILVDGRARPACIMHSATRVKMNGLLILDNADYSYYTAKTHQYLHGFSCSSFYGTGPATYQMWRTDIYVREK